MTTKIRIKPFLAAYFRQKYWDEEAKATKFPTSSLIRVKILFSLRKRPADVPVDSGNLELVVPTSQDFPEKKDTMAWNYIPPSKVSGGPTRPGIERIMENEFYSDLNDYWYRYKYYGLTFKDAVEDFVDIYDLPVDPDTIRKFHTRWQDRSRQFKKTRKYEQQRQLLKKMAENG